MSDVASRFYEQENLYGNEGRRGLENLALLCKRLGYDDINCYGQFVRDTHCGQLGDIFDFFEDNSGAIEAVLNWIDEQNIPEWNEIVPEDTEEEEEEEEDED